MPSRIEDYALVGDCETAALIGRDGSVDWLCFPRFDARACFAALLGTRQHGRWQIAPAAEVRSVRRKYREGTLVLETEFETADGRARLVDCMPGRDHHPRLVRVVEGVTGEVRMRMEMIMRFDYGSIVPWVRRAEGGLRAVGGPDALRLWAGAPLKNEKFTTVSEFTVKKGERVPFVLVWHPSHEPPPPKIDADDAIRAISEWWQAWSARCSGPGPYQEVVRRSLITLKALTYAPTGGVVAAATTSLPEWIGSVRNWDYRYCWLRDATFTLLSLLNAGYPEEAAAWRAWLVRAVAGKPEATNIMYGLGGERRLTEIELDWLPGYENSRPVRIGNAAHKQFQLDVYGEVLDALYQARKHGLANDKEGWRVERALVDFVAEAWRRPDEGIWEVRGPRRHFTHSKVMAWVALDRGVRGVERYGLPGPADRWRKARDEVHAEICAHGFNKSLNSFVQSYDTDLLDASLLMIPLVGFLPASDPRMKGTLVAVEKDLLRDGFVDRYDTSKSNDGLPPGEGTFLACTFWYLDNLALQGRTDEARATFERLLGLCNDVGLLAEEYDPVGKRQLGNFPQAFSHVGLVNTAMNLSRGVRRPSEQRPHN
jgi:GH15 family glucan-1,4-alpha-glucosidase